MNTRYKQAGFFSVLNAAGIKIAEDEGFAYPLAQMHGQQKAVGRLHNSSTKKNQEPVVGGVAAKARGIASSMKGQQSRAKSTKTTTPVIGQSSGRGPGGATR